MRPRIKRRLKFYLSLGGIVTLTIAVGVVFQYLISLSRKMQLGFETVRYDLFMALAAILFIMFISDIYFFFRLILKREY